jgi:membrane-bound lytic murein transglycosylase F
VKSGHRVVTVVVIVACFLAGCQGSARNGRDVDEIQASGELRIVVRPGYFDAPDMGNGGPDEAAILGQLAARLGVRARWIQASRHDHVIAMVEDGHADIGVMRFSPASLLGTRVRATVEVDWVDDLLIAGRATDIASIEDARGGTVHLHRSRVTDGLRAFLKANGLVFEAVAEEIPIEEVLHRVESGRYPMTIADSQIAIAARAPARMTILGPVTERRPLVWAVSENSPQLKLAIDRFFFAERVLSRGTGTAECRDLKLVRLSRVLRLVTRNSATTCAVDRGGLRGFEYELALSFARRLGVILELSIPPPGTEPLEWLERGYGDVAALHEPVSPEDEGRFLVSDPYRRVDLVSVISVRSPQPASVEDLAGVRVAASRPVADLCRLLPLSAPVRARPPDAGSDAFNSMLEVARARFPVAVVDADAAKLEVADRADLSIGPVVLPGVPLVWVLNSTSRQLHREVNRWLGEAQASGLVRQLVLNEFGSHVPLGNRSVLPIPDGALSPYDELLKWVGRRYKIDWRLLASLMYEESRFDPDAVGPGDSAGLFQFMPTTWKELGVDDPHDSQESAEAGGRYLRQLMDQFVGLPLSEQVAMAIASYNVGPRHVFDARQLAEELGFDPDRWLGSVENAMLLLDDPEMARRYPSGVCRCRRAAAYTRRILRRYAAYTAQFPPA